RKSGFSGVQLSLLPKLDLIQPSTLAKFLSDSIRVSLSIFERSDSTQTSFLPSGLILVIVTSLPFSFSGGCPRYQSMRRHEVSTAGPNCNHSGSFSAIPL